MSHGRVSIDQLILSAHANELYEATRHLYYDKGFL